MEEIRENKISKELHNALKSSDRESMRVTTKKPIEDTVSDQLHASVVLVLLFSIALTSLYVTDLTLVFGIIGAFGESLVNFILPGAFLLATAKKLHRMDPDIENKVEY